MAKDALGHGSEKRTDGVQPHKQRLSDVAHKADMNIAENVSHKDSRLLQQWWSRKGYADRREAFGRGPHGQGRFSVWLERT